MLVTSYRYNKIHENVECQTVLMLWDKFSCFYQIIVVQKMSSTSIDLKTLTSCLQLFDHIIISLCVNNKYGYIKRVSIINCKNLSR